MALPAPANYPLISIIQYDPNTPPFIPNIQVSQQMLYLLGPATSLIINETGLKATNSPARMLCYNVLSANFWQNAEFYTIVQLVFGYMQLFINRRQIQTPDVGLQACINDILMMYTSTLICVYPELQVNQAPNVLNAAQQNAQQFNNLKQELSGQQQSMQPQQYQQQQFIQQQQFPQQQQQFPQQQGFPNAFGNSQQSFPSAFGNNQNTAKPDDRFANINAKNGQGQPMPNTFPTAPPNVFASSQSAVFAAPVQSKTEESRELVMEKSNNYITMFGDRYELNTVIRNSKFESSVKNMTKTNLLTTEGDSPYIDPTLMVEVSLDDAIYSSKIKQYRNPKNSGIYRSFNIIPKLFISNLEIKPYITKLCEATDLITLSKKLQSLIKSLATQNSEADKEACDNIICYISYFDKLVTKLINDVLVNKLMITITIDSFVEDAEDLIGYLTTKLDTVKLNWYKECESSIFDSIFTVFTDDDIADIKEVISLPEDLFVTVTPIYYSLTYIMLTEKELNFKSKLDNKALSINKEEALYLYNIAESLAINKKDMQINTQYDVVITSDNVKFKLYQTNSRNTEFSIYRF